MVQRDTRHKASDLMEPADVRALYDRGFDAVLETVSEEERAVLGMIKQFRRRHILWAEVRDDSYYPLEASNTFKGAMCVLPRDHSDVRQGNPLLGIALRPELNILNIQPVKITPEWAGIAQAHELIHLYDRANGIEPARPNRTQYLQGEARAYTTERIAADQLTRGEFSRRMEKFLTENGLSKAKRVQRVLVKPEEGSALVTELSQSVGTSITQTPSLSEGEEAIRNGFYVMALIEAVLKQEGKVMQYTNYIDMMMAASSISRSLMPRR